MISFLVTPRFSALAGCDNNYYKTKTLLAKKDNVQQVLLAEDQAWMKSSSDSDQEINANMVFMAKMEKVLLDSEKSSSFSEETIAEVFYYSSDSKKTFHAAIESASENIDENHIVSQKDHDESESKELKPSLYDERVIGLGHTLMFLTHSEEALEIDKFKRARENKIECFEKIDSPFQQTSSLKPYVPTVILEKIIIDLEDEIVSLLEKQKENLELVESK
ncbi:hypothetical protein Tco_1328906 [Tanacetum coccineum]